MSNNKFKELRRNTLIIAVSNIGSKAISFILAPLYSYYLSTSQYGQMDLITTTVSLIGPLCCLDLYEAAFRFSGDKKYDRQKTFSTIVGVCIPEALILGVISLIFLIVAKSPTLMIFTCVFIFLDSADQILSQFLRGSDRLKEFALSGITNSVFLFASNLIFLVLLKLELKGWILSFLIGKSSMLFYCAFQLKKQYSFKLENVDFSYLKDFLSYCLPLLPTALLWWIMNASDRYILTWMIGLEVTGVYAVANKIPSVLSIFERIFYQSFQISGIKNISDNTNERNQFYTKIFNGYFDVLSLGVLFLLIILKPVTEILFDSSYSEAWKCTSILLVAVLIHALCGNLGTYYTIFKKTKGAALTALYGAVTNIILNIIFIPKYGMIGAASTTLVGYFTSFFIRWFDVKKFVKIKTNRKKIIITSMALIIQFLFYYIDGLFSYLIRVIIFTADLFFNRYLILKLFKGKDI